MYRVSILMKYEFTRKGVDSVSHCLFNEMYGSSKSGDYNYLNEKDEPFVNENSVDRYILCTLKSAKHIASNTKKRKKRSHCIDIRDLIYLLILISAFVHYSII